MSCCNKLKGRLSKQGLYVKGRLTKQNALYVKGRISSRGGVISDHQYLNGLDIPNQHPIPVIIGLQDELDKKLEAGDFATVATTGDIRDLTQTTGEYIVLYCGSATEVI